MAEIEDSQDSVDNPYGDQDFLGSGPPLTDELIAQIKKMIDEAGGDSEEALKEMLTQKLGTLPEPVEPVQPLLTSQFFVLLTFLLLFASLFACDTGAVITKRNHLTEFQRTWQMRI